MKVYLDVCCLNRPFDNHDQARVRLEAAAVDRILRAIDDQTLIQTASTMSLIEIAAIRNPTRRGRVRQLLPPKREIIKLTLAMRKRAQSLQGFGFTPADAVHLACAEAGKVAVFPGCDDQLCRTARRCRQQLKVIVANPVAWLKDHEEDINRRRDRSGGA